MNSKINCSTNVSLNVTYVAVHAVMYVLLNIYSFSMTVTDSVSSFCCSFVTKIAAMGPYEEGEAMESISFIKESDKYLLHQILWDNEDHLSNAIIAMRSVAFQIMEIKLFLFSVLDSMQFY